MNGPSTTGKSKFSVCFVHTVRQDQPAGGKMAAYPDPPPRSPPSRIPLAAYCEAPLPGTCCHGYGCAGRWVTCRSQSPWRWGQTRKDKRPGSKRGGPGREGEERVMSVQEEVREEGNGRCRRGVSETLAKV